MIEIAVKYLERVTGAKPWTGNADRVCRGVVIDSREVSQDSIFVAFPGERVDGNDFAASAIEAGAACVVLTGASAPSSPARIPRSFCSIWRRATAPACAARSSA